MKQLFTVTGPISPIDAGFFQPHEHLALREGASFRCNPALRMDDPEKGAEEAMRYLAAGGRTLIDAQPVGCGRKVSDLLFISQKTGLQILGSTGFHKLCFYEQEHWLKSESEDRLASLFLEELEDGMYEDGDTAFPCCRTEARAGVVKTALDSCGLTPLYERLFRAAAHAAKAADSAMLIHVERGSDPLALLSMLLGLGLSPDRLVFCHTDRACTGPEIPLRLLEAGVYLEMDTIARPQYHGDREELGLLLTLLEAGFEDQLMLSLDTTSARMKSYTPDAIGLDYLLRVFHPMLRSHGVSDAVLKKLNGTNCAAAFASGR